MITIIRAGMSEEIKSTTSPADSQSERAVAGGEPQHHQEPAAEAQASAEAKTPAEATTNRPGPLRLWHDGANVLHQAVYGEDEQDTDLESPVDLWYSDPSADEAPAPEEKANRSGSPAPEEKANRSGGPAPEEKAADSV